VTTPVTPLRTETRKLSTTSGVSTTDPINTLTPTSRLIKVLSTGKTWEREDRWQAGSHTSLGRDSPKSFLSNLVTPCSAPQASLPMISIRVPSATVGSCQELPSLLKSQVALRNFSSTLIHRSTKTVSMLSTSTLLACPTLLSSMTTCLSEKIGTVATLPCSPTSQMTRLSGDLSLRRPSPSTMATTSTSLEETPTTLSELFLVPPSMSYTTRIKLLINSGKSSLPTTKTMISSRWVLMVRATTTRLLVAFPTTMLMASLASSS